MKDMKEQWKWPANHRERFLLEVTAWPIKTPLFRKGRKRGKTWHPVPWLSDWAMTDPNGAAILMVTWIPSIYPLYVSIYHTWILWVNITKSVRQHSSTFVNIRQYHHGCSAPQIGSAPSGHSLSQDAPCVGAKIHRPATYCDIVPQLCHLYIVDRRGTSSPRICCWPP